MKTYGLAVLLLATLVLAGCPNPNAVREGEGAEGAAAGPESQGMGLGADGQLAASPLDDPASPLSKRTIYFEFDSSQVAEEYLDLIAAHGKYLADNPQRRMRVEGHADERGSREYNVGLGERRAKAVERLLRFQGVGNDQVEVVSFGEELPVAFGHDEAAWRLNRRVELVYE
ncbi:MAG: peptidoglycan-associated lipoprotein Pal [Gammaproteobacteria bacterium]|nr:peptidoglycan-associated lipoprotein Pal [Gammaproteobacteria bacterium]MDX5374574.1 peptidoglycan-associated lipoprotein Pal [Gammaproteobacteria bacterium]